jgi:transposase
MGLSRVEQGSMLSGATSPTSSLTRELLRTENCGPCPLGDRVGQIGPIFRLPADRLEEEAIMDTLLFRVAGLDVHKRFVVACVRLTNSESGAVTEEVRRFGTMTGDLHALANWLAAGQVTDVAMESTGVFWKPIWNILESRFRLLLANAHELKQVPGRKSDVKDAQWIAHLLACGLLTPSFVPERAQRELRDLTRYRTTLVDERTRVVNRIHKLLEDTNIKLASVASDVLGVSGRDMLAALVRGETDPEKLANLARGRLQEKLAELKRALVGHVTEHHRFLLDQLLDHLARLEAQIERLSQRITETIRPFVDEGTRRRLDKIPGVNQRTIETVVAEIGTDMSRFPTAGHVSSWTGICPGNEESGGKRKRSRTTQGNRWLRRALVESARAAAHAKDSYFKAQYSRLAARRGKNRAAMAVAHSILVVIYELLSHPESEYQDLGAKYFDQLDPKRLTQHLVKRLEGLGYEVSLHPKAAA